MINLQTSSDEEDDEETADEPGNIGTLIFKGEVRKVYVVQKDDDPTTFIVSENPPAPVPKNQFN